MSDNSERAKTIAEIIALIDHYGELNMELCGDGILMDPLLRGGPWNEANLKISEDCSTMSTIHSAKYHACRELIEQIKALP